MDSNWGLLGGIKSRCLRGGKSKLKIELVKNKSGEKIYLQVSSLFYPFSSPLLFLSPSVSQKAMLEIIWRSGKLIYKGVMTGKEGVVPFCDATDYKQKALTVDTVGHRDRYQN